MSQPSWPDSLPDSLDGKLTDRLLRPAVQPGVIDRRLINLLLNRSQWHKSRLSLLSRFADRQSSGDLQAEPVPIVYAQPLAPSASPLSSAVTPAVVSPGSNQHTIVQAKFIQSANPPQLTDHLPIQSPSHPPLYPLQPQSIATHQTDSTPVRPSEETVTIPPPVMPLIASVQQQPILKEETATAPPPIAPLVNIPQPTQRIHRHDRIPPLPPLHRLSDVDEESNSMQSNPIASNPIASNPIVTQMPIMTVQPILPDGTQLDSPRLPLTHPALNFSEQVQSTLNHASPLNAEKASVKTPKTELSKAIIQLKSKILSEMPDRAINPKSKTQPSPTLPLVKIHSTLGIQTQDKQTDQQPDRTTVRIYSQPTQPMPTQSPIAPELPLLSKTASSSHASSPQMTHPIPSPPVSTITSTSEKTDHKTSDRQRTAVDSTQQSTAIDIDTITEKVQRKLLRQLAVETERRGYSSWR